MHKHLFTCALALLGTNAMHASIVLQQDFSTFTSVGSYVHITAPNSGEFNDISAEADGGNWSITYGQLKIDRAGSYASTNGAGFMRWTDLDGAPSKLHVAVDFGATLDSYQNNSLSIEIGKFTAFSDYNNWPTSNDIFLQFNVDGAGSDLMRFESNSVSSSTYASDGSLYHLEFFLNKSGSSTTYTGPDGTVKTLDDSKYAFWVGTTCVHDNLTANNGANSTLSDFRVRFSTGESGTWFFDNLVIKDTLPPTLPTTSAKLVITPDMLLNELASGDAGLLFDEQTLAGDPLNSPPGGLPVTKFAPPLGASAAWKYPLNTVIDLGAPHVITDIALHDSNGISDVTVSAGTPFDWDVLFTDPQSSFNQWKLHSVSVVTRYLQVSIASSAAAPNELVIYGYPLDYPDPAPTPTSHVRPEIDKFMGVNTFYGEPLHRQEAFGCLREYHDWAWDEGHTQTTYPGYPDNENGFDPAWTGNKNDKFYSDLAFLGLTVCPDIQGNVLWLTGNDGSLLNNKPIPIGSGRDPVDPASYIEHADHLFQHVARYGMVSVSDSLLKLRSDNERLSGLGLLDYYENWNEPDKWWKGRDGYFTPYEYAAMSSADADGHMGTMGSTVGIRNADPGALLVMAGITSPSVDYIKAMKFWCDYNRAGDFPWDVINVHHYCNDGGGQFSGGSGISPEEGNLREHMELIREYRDQYLPGVEVWISEFGYDTNPGSSQHAPIIGAFSAEEVQAQWLVRSYLELAAAGVDRAFAYHLVDFGSSSGLYTTSGMLKRKADNYETKISWWYLYSLKNRLKGLRFESEQASGNSDVKIYRFQDDQDEVKAYAVWCPTSDETTVSSYSLAVPSGISTASLVTLTDGDPDGVKSGLTITGDTVSIDVSERPVFVLLDHTDPDFELTEKLTLTTAMVTNESGYGDAEMLVDEQTLAGDPREEGGAGSPTTIWAPGSGTASAYIDLGSVKSLDRIFIRDMNGIGDLTISTGTPGSWTVLKVDELERFESWKMHVVDLDTRYLRFTRADGQANFSEVVLYGK
ncbi:hypothetical protein [Cerasicoccus arenae]|uniref:Asl1-like glycosyl hydrolase catalytic domain-containing protein n=1 Tax=Cerasicoccus arenae TaxID=424488 RepID=A0A8J3DFD4_9BACT|nr:hypothetical protein [Cerasicoccus arenae]MBK1859852.1 hypothetical protein [Cerasicoccus arenae]GHB93430.1 hypothetical protein GCM10007047_06100 [Cerasicoccus arenae]